MAVNLDDHGFDACQMQNVGRVWPIEPDVDGNRFLSVGFGESNCHITLKNCHEETCYTTFDLTSLQPVDDPPASSSIFHSLNVTGAKMKWTSKGLGFEPTQSTVTISYSTVSCAAFYALRGGAFPQDCAKKHFVLSPVEADIPSSICPS